MKRVSTSAFQAEVGTYLRSVETTGEALVVTDRGRPVVRIEPYETADDVLGRLRGCVLRYDGPTEPIARDDWETIP